MTDTLQNIKLTKNTWVDLYAATGFTVGKQIVISNLTTIPVKVFSGAVVPVGAEDEDDTGSFDRVMRYEEFTNDSLATGAWAFSYTDGLINVRLKQPDPATDYFIEVALGNIQGTTGTGKVSMTGIATNAGYTDIWGGLADMVFPTANETWNISSTSDNDTLLGTGSRTVVVNYLDFDYVPKSVIIDLDGQNPVQVATDCYRPNNIVVIDSGSLKNNEGLLTIVDSVSGNPRGFVPPTFGASEDTYISVPAGKTLLILKVSPYLGKDDSGDLKGLVEFFGTNTILTTGIFPVYQNTFDVDFKVPFPVPEKTDFWYSFKSNNPAPTTVNFVIEYILKDN